MPSAKSIAIVCDGIWDQLQGGAEYQLHLLAKELSIRGYDVHYVFTDRGSPVDASFLTPHPLRLPRWIRWLAYPYHFLLAPQVARALSRIQPDLIINRVGSALTGVCARYGKVHDIPTVWHIANITDVDPPKLTVNRTLPFAWLDRRLLNYGVRNTSKIIAQAEYQGELLSRHFGRQPAAVIPNFHPVPCQPASKVDPPLVVWVANIKPKKRPEAFLDMIQSIAGEVSARFVMIGRPAEGRYQMAISHHLAQTPAVEFLGELGIEQVNALLAQASVFVNTSAVEGFPNTFIQAWLREAPVVSLEIDPDDVIKREGLGYCSGTIEQLCIDTRRLIEDEALRAEVGCRAAAYAQRTYDVKTNVDRMLSVIDPVEDGAANDSGSVTLRYLAMSADQFPPFRVDTTILFGEELAKRGHRFDWIMQSESTCARPYTYDWNGNRIWVARTDTGTARWRRVRKHLLVLSHQLRVLWRTRRQPYDFYLVKNKYLISVPVLLFAKLRKKPFFFWLSYPHVEEGMHKVELGTARYPVFYRIRARLLSYLLYRVVMPRSTHVFVQSEKMRQDIAGYGVPLDKLSPVPMGVSLKEFDAMCQAVTAPFLHVGVREAPSVVYVGTLQSARKLDFVVRVMALVLARVPSAKLLLVGDGDDPADRELILAEGRRLGIESAVSITGFLPREEAMAYVRAATVCISPFAPDPILQSTSPTKLVEYWACSKAVVASDHPEQRQMIAECGGGICVPHEEGAFAEGILELLADPIKADRMGRAGRRYVEECRDYPVIADHLDRKIRSLINMAKAGSASAL